MTKQHTNIYTTRKRREKKILSFKIYLYFVIYISFSLSCGSFFLYWFQKQQTNKQTQKFTYKKFAINICQKAKFNFFFLFSIPGSFFFTYLIVIDDLYSSISFVFFCLLI